MSKTNFAIINKYSRQVIYQGTSNLALTAVYHSI